MTVVHTGLRPPGPTWPAPQHGARLRKPALRKHPATWTLFVLTHPALAADILCPHGMLTVSPKPLQAPRPQLLPGSGRPVPTPPFLSTPEFSLVLVNKSMLCIFY